MKCYKCGEETKPKQSLCAEHKRQASRLNYQQNKERYKARTIKQKAIRQQYVYDYLKTHPCIECGETEPLYLDFDHVKGDKIEDICRMVLNFRSLGAIAEEMNKCEVVCVRCHRRRTAQRGNWFRFALID